MEKFTPEQKEKAKRAYNKVIRQRSEGLWTEEQNVVLTEVNFILDRPRIIKIQDDAFENGAGCSKPVYGGEKACFAIRNHA